MVVAKLSFESLKIKLKVTKSNRMKNPDKKYAKINRKKSLKVSCDKFFQPSYQIIISILSTHSIGITTSCVEQKWGFSHVEVRANINLFFSGKNMVPVWENRCQNFLAIFPRFFSYFFFLSFSLEERDAKPSSDVVTPKITKLRHKTRKSKISTIFSAVASRELAPSPRSRMVYFIT